MHQPCICNRHLLSSKKKYKEKNEIHQLLQRQQLPQQETMNLGELLDKLTTMATSVAPLERCSYVSSTSGGDAAAINDSKMKIENFRTVSRMSMHILEIGFGAGHSASVFLAANPFATVTCVDNCSKAYTRPNFEYLKSIFGERLNLLECESRELSEKLDRSFLKKFDCIHIDGSTDQQGHVYDTMVTLRYANDSCHYIFNETEDMVVNSWIRILLNTNVFRMSRLPIYQTNVSKQDILEFKRPRYAICTVAKGDEYCEKVRNCIISKYVYADYYGYRLITDDYTDIGDLGIGWHKNFQMRKYLKDYDYLFWIDADAMIMNYTVSLDLLFLMLPSQYNILVSNDPNGLNSGVMLLKNCEEVNLMLSNIPRMDRKYLYTGIYEQLPMMVLKEINFFPNMFYTIHQNVWNSYDPQIWTKTIPTFDGFRTGDFIVHFAGYNTWPDQEERNLQKADREFGEKRGFHPLPYDRFISVFK